MKMSNLIDIQNLTYVHALRDENDLPALQGVSLQIEEGEMVAIVGANGSGKTTLARHLNALLLPSEGAVRIAGLDTRLADNRQMIQATVGMVFQFPEDQMVATVVEEDVAFGPENLGLPPAEVRQRVESALREVGMWEWRQRPPHLLSAGQMQRVALAGILAMRPRCIVFDEATAMLDPAGRRTVMSMLHRLNQDGLTILYITHFMDEAAQAQRVIVLNQGRVALDGAPHQVFADSARLEKLGLDLPPAVKAAGVLRAAFPDLPEDLLTIDALLDALPIYGKPAVLPAAPEAASPVVLSPDFIHVSGLSHTYLKETPFAYQALHGIDFSVAEGGAQGLIGGTGSGKSTLLQHLNGLLKPQTGQVRVGSYDLNDPAVTVYQVCRSVGLVFQNPEAQFFEQYAGDEIAYGPRLMGLEKADLRQRVQWAMDLVGLDFEDYKDRLTFTLSGGERRKVALAAILALQPQVLLLDEPTAGLDPQARKELISRLKTLRSAGMTLVVSSHQMDDLVALTERVTVLRQGEVALDGALGEVFSHTRALGELGLTPPVAARAAERLRANGWPLPDGIVHLNGLADALADMTGGGR
jgi:energy-coupling factor transport system ATP-binding protein